MPTCIHKCRNIYSGPSVVIRTLYLKKTPSSSTQYFELNKKVIKPYTIEFKRENFKDFPGKICITTYRSAFTTFIQI